MSCLTFKWGTATKASRQGSSLFVGTSPAFEIALFSVCFLQYPGDQCGCNIGTSSSVTVQTYSSATSVPSITAVATAYPSEVSSLGEHFKLHRDVYFVLTIGLTSKFITHRGTNGGKGWVDPSWVLLCYNFGKSKLLIVSLIGTTRWHKYGDIWRGWRVCNVIQKQIPSWYY